MSKEVAFSRCVIVCCHGIFTGGVPTDRSSWLLAPYQDDEEPQQYLQHIGKGIEIAGELEGTVLIFSGGFTKKETPHLSEAQSYLNAARAASLLSEEEPFPIILEEYARDSYENILFSMCVFYQKYGIFPRGMSLITWEFKVRRFREHCEALALAEEDYRIIGVGNPADMEKVAVGEQKAVELFRASPYGLSAELMQKKASRDPFSRGNPYKETIAPLLHFFSRKDTMPFDFSFPWQK